MVDNKPIIYNQVRVIKNLIIKISKLNLTVIVIEHLITIKMKEFLWNKIITLPNIQVKEVALEILILQYKVLVLTKKVNK